ncbi:MAG: hypothetical protein ABIO49_06860 [Dokdonella sp.]
MRNSKLRFSQIKSTSGATTNQNGIVAPNAAPARAAGTHIHTMKPSAAHAASTIGSTDDFAAVTRPTEYDEDTRRAGLRRARGRN